MVYKAIIIDDEPKLREVLDIKIKQIDADILVCEKCSSASAGFDAIKRHKPDLIFLDISMPGESGFQMLDRIDKIDFQIIFVTGFNEYGLDAIKLSAVDYLLKPVKTIDLKIAINKAKDRIESITKAQKYENLKHNLHHLGDQKTKLAIPGTSAYQFISILDIIRCEGWQKYTKIHLADGNCIVSSYNLGTFREMLNKYNFYSTHKSHLINVEHIKTYLKEGIIIMSDESQVPVSRRRRDDFFDTFVRKVHS